MNANRFPMKFEGADVPMVIDIARPEQTEEIMSFLKEHFLSKKPISSINLCDPNPNYYEPIVTFVLDAVQRSLKQSLTLIVRETQTGQLVAARINELEKKGNEKGDQSHNSTELDLLAPTMIAAIEEGCDVFNLYETNCILHFCLVAVDSKYGRLGLASLLYQLSFKIAIEKGAGAAVVAAFSSFTARAAAKLGFTTLKEITYASFKYKGTTPLAGCKELVDEHPTVRFMARRLP